MILSSQLRPGIILKLDGHLYKVIESTTHSGTARTGMMVHAELRDLDTGALTERRFASDEKLQDLPAQRVRMQFLYREGDQHIFMNPETYDQVPISRRSIGPAASFLKENDLVEVEFYENKPLSAIYPEVVEIRVVSTGVGIRGQSDSTYKEAALENGVVLLVPQFVQDGDAIRVHVETGKYVDRVQEKAKDKDKEKRKRAAT